MQYFELIRYHDPNTSEKKALRILDDLSADWENIGETLGFKPPLIDHIIRHAGSGNTPIQCLREVISQWMLDVVGIPLSVHYPCSLGGLYNMLIDSEHGAIANDLKVAITTSSSDIHGNFDDGENYIEDHALSCFSRSLSCCDSKSHL